MYAKLEQKECLQCKETKSIDLFRLRLRKSRHNRESYCKACEKLNYKKWYLAHREELKHRDYVRNCKKFGITSDDYEKMFNKQKGLCAICKGPETRTRSGRIKRLAVDHCHIRGTVRALLCCDCNTAIGLLKEEPRIARAVVYYLNKFKSRR